MNIFSKISILLCAAVLFASCSQKQVESTTQSNKVFTVNKGLNISHWLSQVYGFSPRATYITEKDIAFIDSCGFDHIRLPFDEKELWDEKGVRHDTAFAYLDSCVNWALKYDLKVVLDFHILRSHYFNAENEKGAAPNTLWEDTVAQNFFISLWLDFQKTAKIKNVIF